MAKRPPLGPSNERCYCCNRAFRLNGHGNIPYHPEVLTIDGQRQGVGYDCFRKVDDAGAEGYQPPLGGPRLYTEAHAPAETLRAAGITRIVHEAGRG